MIRRMMVLSTSLSDQAEISLFIHSWHGSLRSRLGLSNTSAFPFVCPCLSRSRASEDQDHENVNVKKKNLFVIGQFSFGKGSGQSYFAGWFSQTYVLWLFC